MNEKMIYNFNQSKHDELEWYIVNDEVMGGLSQSRIYRSPEGLGVFEGQVSLENNGGFAMTQLNCEVHNVKDFSHIVLKIKGDGKAFQFRVKDNRDQYYSFTQNFSTTGSVQTIRLKLSDFQPYFRGRKLNLPNFNKNSIEQIGILIGNKKEEHFRLEIYKIAFY